MTRIIHASDFQLGKHFTEVGKSGDFVRKALKESLETTIKLAIDRSVDAVLVTGNLFATNLVSRHLVSWFYEQVDRLGKIPFVALPGNSDPLDENSIYRHLPEDSRPENLHILGLNNSPIHRCPESSVTFYRIPSLDSKTALTTKQDKQDYPGSHIATVILKESPKDDCALKSYRDLIESLHQSGFEYIAVGGNDSFVPFTPFSCSSGTPEATAFGNTDPGQILLVDVNGDQVSYEKITTGKLVWKHLELDNEKFHYNIELEEELAKYASPETLLRIRMDGKISRDGYLDLMALERTFKDQFCFLEIEDCRRFVVDEDIVVTNGSGSLMNDFTSLMREAIDKAPQELRQKYHKAMLTGTAMLTGKDVIG